MVAWTGNGASIGGQVLDGQDADGTKWGISDIEGWGSTDPTLELLQRTRRSGASGGESFGGPRSVSISGWVKTSPELLSHAGDRLIAAVSRTPVPLVMIEENRARSAVVQRSGAVLFRPRRRGYATWSVQVRSKDWRKFGTPLIGTTRLPATSGGLTVPFTVPFTIDATVESGQISLINSGNEIGPVTARIDGPTAGPIITHNSGAVLSFSSGLVLLDGEWIDIDMERHTVLANGQASRSGYLLSRGWSGFAPGINTWSLSSSVYDPDALLTLTATPAWE